MAFLETFVEHRNGGMAIDMQAAMEEVIKAVRATGKAGKFSLTISVKPATKGDRDVDMVFLQDAIKVDAPKPDKKISMFFVNEENQLTRNDTRQMNMLDGLREVDITPQNVKEIR